MNNKNQKDERVIRERQKIQSDGYQLVIIILAISILIQFFLLRAPFEQYSVEFLLLMGMGPYVLFRQFQLGVESFENPKAGIGSAIGKGILYGAMTTLFYCLVSGVDLIWDGLIFFFCFTLGTIGFNLFAGQLSERRQRRRDMDLDLDEEEWKVDDDR